MRGRMRSSRQRRANLLARQGVNKNGGNGEPAAWIESFYIEGIAATDQTGNFDLVSDSSFQEVGAFSRPGTPKAVKVIAFHADSFSMGYATGSGEQFHISIHDEFSAATINSDTRLEDTNMGVCEDGGDTIELEFSFVEFLPNGVRVNITTNTVGSFGVNIVVICFGGTSCQAQAITHDVDGNAVNNTVDVTALDFEPELVFSHIGNSGHTALGRTANANFNFGITHNDGGADPQPQFGYAYELENGTNAQQLRSQHRNTSGYALIAEANGGADLVAAELLGFDATGFTVHCRERTNWGTTKAGALCLSWGGDADIHLQAIDSETTDITQAHTDPGWKPDFMYMTCNRSGSTATETVGTNDDLAGGMAGAWTSPRDGDPDPDEVGTDIRGRWKCLGDDNNGNGTMTKSSSVSANGIFPSQPLDPTRTSSHSAAQFLRVDFESFDASGYTIDYVDAASGVKSIIVLAIRDNTV